MAKDNVDLICDIGELSGLFEKSRGLDDFLQAAVSVVAYHMRAAVCSIYLYEEHRGELVLAATQGLNPLAIGQRLKIGEGITGASLKELRTICEGYGSRNPNFKYIEGIEEERYEAFLAVPIVRGMTRVGVLVAQDSQPNYFSDNDAKALRAIATQLAMVIENAKLLMDLHGRQEEEEKPEVDELLARLHFIKGKSVSSGIALGEGVVIDSASYDVLMAAVDDDIDTEACLQEFHRALAETETQLKDLQERMEEQLSDVASLIFSAHLLILQDAAFSGDMESMICKGMGAERAVTNVVNNYINLFSASENPRLQEKVVDVKDLGHRILRNIKNEGEQTADYRNQVVVAGELLPSDLLKLAAQRVEGIIIVHGTPTSHISILARSLQVPMVFVDTPEILEVAEGATLLVDGIQGTVYVEPSSHVLEGYESIIKEQTLETGSLAEAATYTRDGTRVRIQSNINLLSDLKSARDNCAEGVGLYRSEFPFIVRHEFPSEEAQYKIYRKIFDAMPGQEVTLRTLDVGGDKMLPYHNHNKEANPFLGLRAIRFTLSNRPIFVQQLRAMLRAGHDADMRIMFPFISSVDDFLESKEVVRECIEALQHEGLPHHSKPKIGPMIELPAAVSVIDELAQESDFLCLGTNDLIQYMLAVDRTNELVSSFYVSHHPAVLRALNRVADAAITYDVDLSLCGDMALDERMLSFLIGIGIRKISMDPRQIPRIQKAIQKLHIEESTRRARRMLRIGKLSELNAFIEQQDEG